MKEDDDEEEEEEDDDEASVLLYSQMFSALSSWHSNSPSHLQRQSRYLREESQSSAVEGRRAKNKIKIQMAL